MKWEYLLKYVTILDLASLELTHQLTVQNMLFYKYFKHLSLLKLMQKNQDKLQELQQQKVEEPATDQNLPDHHSFDPIPLRINADSSRPRHVLCFWLTFFYIIGISIILAIFVAPKEIIIKSNATELKNTIDDSCMNPCGFENNTLICNPFGLHNPKLGLLLRNLDLLNQFALIYLDLGVQSERINHELSQNLSIELYSLQLNKSGQYGRFTMKQSLANRTIQYEDSDKIKTSFTFYGQKIYHLIGFYRQLEESNYLLVVKFSNPEQMINIEFKPTLKAILINPQFSLFVIIIRGIGFVITLITGIVYMIKYRKVEPSQRLIQQKLVLVMSFLVLLFNDPFYSLSVLKPSTFMSVLSVIFLTQFIAYLFFFWILGAERILREEGSPISKILTFPKKVLYSAYFISYLVVLTWYYSGIAISSYEGHFIVNPQQISPGLSFVFLMWLIINITIYGWLVLRIFQVEGAVLWRSKIWLHFNFYFALLLTIFVIVTGSIYQQSSKLLLITYTSLNLYCIYMQFMFTASHSKHEQVNKLIPISNTDLEGNQTSDIEMDDPNLPKDGKSSLSEEV